MPKCIELLPCYWLISNLCYQAIEQVYLIKWPVSAYVYIYIYIYMYILLLLFYSVVEISFHRYDFRRNWIKKYIYFGFQEKKSVIQVGTT